MIFVSKSGGNVIELWLTVAFSRVRWDQDWLCKEPFSDSNFDLFSTSWTSDNLSVETGRVKRILVKKHFPCEDKDDYKNEDPKWKRCQRISREGVLLLSSELKKLIVNRDTDLLLESLDEPTPAIFFSTSQKSSLAQTKNWKCQSSQTPIKNQLVFHYRFHFFP